MRLRSFFWVLAGIVPWQGIAAADAPAVIEEMVIVGSQVDVVPVYAGGQVARGGRVGIFGNVDMMASPFAAAAYTDALARDQQATSIGDVLENDPVVRVAKGFGNFQELYVIRGFPVYSDDMTYNGVYGVLPRQFVAAELVERVEVLRSANSFVNGAAPGGSGVGGAFNLLPKRAGAEPLTRLTAGLEAPGQAYLAADIARRFGSDDALGVRVNAVRRDGETSIEDQARELSVLALGTDYAGARLRFALDIGWQDHHIDSPRPQVTPTGEAPRPPRADENFAQPWTLTDERQLFGVLRGEWDASDAASLWLAVGGRRGEEGNILANPNANRAGVTAALRFDNAREDEIVSADAGLRWDIGTGAVAHRLVLAASRVTIASRNAFAFSSFARFAGDLYAPFDVPPPLPNAFVGGELSNPRVTEEVEHRSIALADVLSMLGGRMQLTLGVRRQWIDTDAFNATSGQRTGGYDDDAVTPVVAAVYRLGDTFTIYANHAGSVQPGAIAPASSGGLPVLNAGEVLEPFRGAQYELGVKFDVGELAGSASLFSLSRPTAIVDGQVFRDDGEERSRGVEFSVFGEPVEGFRLVGGLTWLDAELERTQGGTNDGNAPIGVPDWQVNLNAEYDVAAVSGLVLEARLMHTSEQQLDQANTRSIDDWTRVDVGARWSTTIGETAITTRLRIDNLLDEDYWASTGGFPGSNYLVLGAPRTLSLSASVEL